MGTKEARNILKKSGVIKFGSVTIRKHSTLYKVADSTNGIFLTSNINIALDYLVSQGLIAETRFRLTPEERDFIRMNIWNYFGLSAWVGIGTVMGYCIIMSIR